MTCHICLCSDFLDHDDLPSNGLAVTPDHITEEDDRSSHASSSDWTPQPQIGKQVNPSRTGQAELFNTLKVFVRRKVKVAVQKQAAMQRSSRTDMLTSLSGSYSFIQQHIRETDPRTILRDLLPETVLPPDLDDMTLWQIIINISEPPKRKKRKDINTLEDVVRLLHESKRILVLTGAGVCSFSRTIQLYYYK